MDTSMNLITAQISFLEGRFALIHIPLEYYPFFLQPIQRLLFGEDHDEDASKIPWPYRHDFLNVSITPIECSIVCSRDLATRFFRPLVERFADLLGGGDQSDHVHISLEDFEVIQVDGQGLDAGQRVLELTSPLALAGISIFFQTTYFSDYILVPHKSIHTVIQTLEQRGFTFSPSAAAYVSHLSPSSPITPRHNRHSSTSNPFDFPSSSSAPSTPPASNINELRKQTFSKLKRAGIVPDVDRSIRLLSCAARKETNKVLNAQLRDDLLQVLLATCPGTNTYHENDNQAPKFSTRFLSLTLTSEEPISLLLESSLLSNPNLALASTLLFSRSSTSYSPEDEGSPGAGKNVLIPITLDLRHLPLEATGIICGVAGCLAQVTNHSDHSKDGRNHPDDDGEKLSPKTVNTESFMKQIEVRQGSASEAEAQENAVEISFLSTARAGTVIVREKELERAIRALEFGAEMVSPPRVGNAEI
ncbi:hypothetical protein GJ744_001120 [Endocarpon pusillum]|uniref:CASTOR ACT domain-containing protein n=1 Tax=Endocarpon pusillum TaxID=364733 RepID=A0A8H7E0U9_9EURO|nr:hypothetical protein GJ744_001120 [Endocarpon pusillum]